MQLSQHQAYLAMYAFLSEIYTRTHSDELGALLGSMSLLPDGGTADPAIRHEWQAAVAAALAGEVDATMALSPGGPSGRAV